MQITRREEWLGVKLYYQTLTERRGAAERRSTGAFACGNVRLLVTYAQPLKIYGTSPPLL